MADAPYAVVFQGQCADGVDEATVRANLAKLFNADAARIEKMFGGRKVVIKKGLDAEAARKYKAVLSKAGAVVSIMDTSASAIAAPAAESQATAEAAAPAPEPAALTAVDPVKADESTVAEPAAARPDAGQPPQTVPDAYADAENPPTAIDSSLAEPGETLVEYQPPEAPDIAIDHLSMAEAGATLVEVEAVPEPEFDLSAMTLDEPGVTLVEPEKITPPEYDLSGMSLDENPDTPTVQ